MLKNYTTRTFDSNSVAAYILEQLHEEGAYIFHKALTTNSIYIKFRNPRLKSLTIRDHNTRKKYRYKWNLRLDKAGREVELDSGIRRYYYGITDYKDLIRHIKNYNKKLERG